MASLPSAARERGGPSRKHILQHIPSQNLWRSTVSNQLDLIDLINSAKGHGDGFCNDGSVQRPLPVEYTGVWDKPSLFDLLESTECYTGVEIADKQEWASGRTPNDEYYTAYILRCGGRRIGLTHYTNNGWSAVSAWPVLDDVTAEAHGIDSAESWYSNCGAEETPVVVMDAANVEIEAE